MKRILITGSSGFIGFHLSKALSTNCLVLGIDNHNNYYSKKIKNKRLSILKKNKNFFFNKINLKNNNKLKNIIKKFNPNIVFHIAGQPGVLYSFKNPKSYKVNNVDVTKNLCKICKDIDVEKFIFASSSSVYGDQKNFPIRENFSLNPKNFYAKTKLKSEKIVSKMFNKSNTKFIIFRFFTVYGPFGRPDMFIHKFLNSVKKNKVIKVHNRGLNFRDFTYVDDVVKILKISIQKKINKKIINICRSNPIRTDKLISLLLSYNNKKYKKIKMIDFVKGEMLKTHGSNSKLFKYIGKLKFTELNTGIKNTIKNFKKYGY